MGKPGFRREQRTEQVTAGTQVPNSSPVWSGSSPQLKYHLLGFPGGAVVENLPADAGDTGSSPGLGGSHMPRSGWAREPRLLSLRVWSLCPAAGGGPRW